jgi:hypothetical protein
MFDRGDQLLWRPGVVAVVRLGTAREGDRGAVVEVVVPQGVEAMAACLRRPDESRLLLLVLGDEEHRPAARPLARAA